MSMISAVVRNLELATKAQTDFLAVCSAYQGELGKGQDSDESRRRYHMAVNRASDAWRLLGQTVGNCPEAIAALTCLREKMA